MRVEHVDVDAHSDFVAQPVGIQRALAGGLGGFERGDLALARLHAVERGARGLRHAAARIVEVGLGLALQRQGFLDAVLHREAGKQRQIQLHTHVGDIGAKAVVGRRDGALRVVVDAVGGLQIHRGKMAGFGLARFEPGDIKGQLGLAQLRLRALRHVDPGLGIGRRQRRQHHGLGQRQHARRAHQLLERQALDAQIVVGGDFLGNDQVVARLGFARVRDGGIADIEIALRKGALLGYGLLLRLHETQRVFGAKHIEVGLAGAHDQVLLGSIALGQGDFKAALALREGNAVGGTVQRLRRAQRGGLRAGVEREVGLADFGARAAGAGLQADRRQQTGACLLRAAVGGIGLGLARLPHGIEAARALGEFDQALRLRQRRESEDCQESAGIAPGAGREPQRAGQGHGIPCKEKPAARPLRLQGLGGKRPRRHRRSFSIAEPPGRAHASRRRFRR